MIALNEINPRTRVLMRFAKDLATLSKCTERKVGAVITDRLGQQIYAIGINGGPRGSYQCLCTLGGKYGCVHAEANAIAKDTSYDSDKVMFMTLSPCPACAALMVNHGIKRVFYTEQWKDTAGLTLLREAGVAVTKMEDD